MKRKRSDHGTRIAILLLVLCCPMTSSQAFDIVEALERGQQVQLAKCAAEDDSTEGAAIIKASFERVREAAGLPQHIQLRLARCNAMVQVVAGQVVAHPSLADWNEGERLFGDTVSSIS